MISLREKWISLAQHHHQALTWLVSLSLIGLLMIQAYWINVEVRLQERKLQDTMQDVLLDMHHQIEDSQSTSEDLIEIFTAYQQQEPLPQSLVKRSRERVQHMMDSVLQAFHLSSLRYDFAFYHTVKEDLIISSSAEAKELSDFQKYSERAGYRVRNALGEGQYRFGIFFHNEFWFLIQQTLWLLILSFLFLLLLMGSFMSTLFALGRQKRVSQMKNDFINNLAHELKTPVFASSVIFKIIQKHQQTGHYEKLAEPLNLLERENQLLKQKIEHVLDFASFEEGKLPIQFEKTDLHELIRQSLPVYAYQVKSRGGEINCALNAPSAFVYADPRHLLNLLQNILDNALKYSPDTPQIFIKTQLAGEQIKLSIEDKGIGISEADQQHIFDKFYRVTQGDAHDIKGFGLGLSYVKLITELHGGLIQLKSKKGVGTTFMFTFPLYHTQPQVHAYKA
jgi:two-component system phosphate regulon sensor histidine kinase PhoR